MDQDFGLNVVKEAQKLAGSGRDANQIAKILCDRDSQGCNYGIGILLEGNGQPMPSSAILTQYVMKELQASDKGDYMNSAKIFEAAKKSILQWQRVPEEFWENFIIAFPSDAGTGTVQTAIGLALLLKPDTATLGIQELGWPAYKAIAKSARVSFKEYPLDAVINEQGVLPVYQSGPMNTTGFVVSRETVQTRAESAAASGIPLVLDRAYSGFEFARLVDSQNYPDIMEKSYHLQIEPFIKAAVTFALAISPTKAFVTFSLRPCGILLVYCPDSSQLHAISNSVNSLVRARGSSFEHPITRAFIKAMANNINGLEKEHIAALSRVAQAESTWRKYIAGSAIERLFSEEYAGLFRNPRAKENAAIAIYSRHIYPVFAENRCRLNVTGIPDDEELACSHVQLFAEQCFE